MAEEKTLPFHRKYRPKTIAEYIGNTKLKESMFGAFKAATKPQVILLYGDSGCGKTTMARLIAKEYSCENRSEEMGACNICDNCVAINNYIATGDTNYVTTIQEIDITDQSGKKDLDSTLADMMIPAFGDDWKIYIFDEVHMATQGLQNRLLKIAEEPPEHVLMILCTTNPEKIIETLYNRCQLKLKVSKPTVKELAGLLRGVCNAEGADYDTKGLEFIAQRGECTIRTALTNLEQVINEKQDAKYESAIQVFEQISNTVIIEFFRAFKRHDTLGYINKLFDIKKKTDLNTFLVDLTNFVKRGIYTVNGIALDDISDGELKVYRELFGDMGIEKITFLLQKLTSLDKQNLEIELITLGYTGLNATSQPEEKVLDSIQGLDNELVAEKQATDDILAEKAKTEFNQGVANADNYTKPVDMSFFASLGATVVK